MRRENRDHRVPGRISGLPSGARPAARSRDQAASADRGGGGIAAGAAHGRTDSAGPRPRWRRSRWRSEERETIGAIQTGQAQPRHLQPHVPARSRRPLRRARDRQHRAPAPKGRPVPSCTALLDQLHDAAEHATQHINLAVLANTSLPRPLTFAQERGWRHLRLPSPAANTYNRVFHRDQDTTRHFWSSNSSTPPPTAIRTRVTSPPSSRSTGRGLAGAQGCHRVIASSC